MQIKLGISPIAWWNDDLVSLSEDVSLEECMSQAQAAGYSGMETGRRFPKDPQTLCPILQAHGLCVCGGWHSGLLLEGDIEAEKDRIGAQMALFKAAIMGQRDTPLARKPVLDEAQIRAYGHKLTAFAEWCAAQGMPIAFHHHMGTAIETPAELDLLMTHTGDALALLLDTGHLAFAGGDVIAAIRKHSRRLAHVHAKDVRRKVLDGIDPARESFLDAVIKGVFTVPGDGSLDFEAITACLADHGYEGWIVIEAEQDPASNPPWEMAKTGYRELLRVAAAAGYEVVP